jgi:acetate kinase
MDYLGIKIDQDKNNNAVGVTADISAADSKIKILVIPTDEELMIARDTNDIVTALN